MKEPSSKVPAAFKSGKEVKYAPASEIRTPFSPPGLKGRGKGYQNPARPVTSGLAERATGQNLCPPAHKTQSSSGNTNQQEGTGSCSCPLARANQKPKSKSSADTVHRSHFPEQGGDEIWRGTERCSK